jgi:putative PIN family toxin of toxin-antitoxin system
VRFFLDSNVLVSGIVFSGTERWILLATFRGEHTFVISQDVQREVLEVMKEKFPRRREEAKEVLSLPRVEIVPRRVYERRSREFPGLRDPKDAHVSPAAIVSRCDAIVTGDRDLIVLGAVEGVDILRPSQARRLIATAT